MNQTIGEQIFNSSVPTGVFQDDVTVEIPDQQNIAPSIDLNITNITLPPKENASTAPNGLGILVAIFFFVAAAWLLIAVFYAILAFVALRLRSQGRLEIHDESFGRYYLCGTRFYIPFGWILRRYVVAFGHDQPERHRQSNYRYISRSERRLAVKQILLGSDANQKEDYMHQETSMSDEDNYERRGMEKEGASTESKLAIGFELCDTQSTEEPVCSICLTEYENGKKEFDSKVCNHRYHLKCILDWLERKSNRDCPCCRAQLITERAIWEEVKCIRKEKKKQARKRTRKEDKCHASKSWGNTKNKRSCNGVDGQMEGQDNKAMSYPNNKNEIFLRLPEAAENTSKSSDDASHIACSLAGDTTSWIGTNGSDADKFPSALIGDLCTYASLAGIEHGIEAANRHESHDIESTMCDEDSNIGSSLARQVTGVASNSILCALEHEQDIKHKIEDQKGEPFHEIAAVSTAQPGTAPVNGEGSIPGLDVEQAGESLSIDDDCRELRDYDPVD